MTIDEFKKLSNMPEPLQKRVDQQIRTLGKTSILMTWETNFDEVKWTLIDPEDVYKTEENH